MLTSSLVAHDLWGSGPSDVWAVADAGVVAHWDGGAWSEVTLPTDYDLNAVWGTGSQVFVAGDDGWGSGEVYEWDGNQWIDLTSGIIVAIASRMPSASSCDRSSTGIGPLAPTTVTVLTPGANPRSTLSGSHGEDSSSSAMQYVYLPGWP